MSAETITTDVYVDEIALEHKLENLIDDTVMLQVNNLFAKMCDPYVPYLENPLSTTLEITSEYVKYLVPYAHYQYTGDNFNFTKDRHPLATARWDKVMMQNHRDEFEQQVKELLLARAKKLYG